MGMTRTMWRLQPLQIHAELRNTRAMETAMTTTIMRAASTTAVTAVSRAWRRASSTRNFARNANAKTRSMVVGTRITRVMATVTTRTIPQDVTLMEVIVVSLKW